MSSSLNTLAAYLEADRWPVTTAEQINSLRTRYRGANGEWTCYAQVHDADQVVLFYSICPVLVPHRQRVRIAELLTRANYGLAIGNFELDFAEGEIRYKTSIHRADEELSPAHIEKLIYTNVATMDHYLPSIRSVLYEDVAPVDAIGQVESD